MSNKFEYSDFEKQKNKEFKRREGRRTIKKEEKKRRKGYRDKKTINN